MTLETNPGDLDRPANARVSRRGSQSCQFRCPIIQGLRAEAAGAAALFCAGVEAVDEARTARFDNISLDLMMWLPQQSPSDWAESVRRAD